MFTRRLRYFALGNLIELATYVTTILLVADFDHCNRSVGVRSVSDSSMEIILTFC